MPDTAAKPSEAAIKITESRYKDIFAVRVETPRLIAYFLPRNGAKLTSLIDKASGEELLAQAVGEKYKPIGLCDDYVGGECSAFDDMFPTIDPYTPEIGSRKGVSYIDHGEVARSGFSYSIQSDALIMVYASERLNFVYSKRISANPDGSLRVFYEIGNSADDEFEYLWAAHIMIAAKEGGQAVTSYGGGVETVIMFDDFGKFGKRGDLLPYRAEMTKSAKFDEKGDAYKLYFTSAAPRGRLGYVYPDGKTLTLTYDEKKLPYIGIWMNNGHFKGMYSCAPEIASVPYDSPAEAAAKGIKSVIAPRGCVNFSIDIDIER